MKVLNCVAILLVVALLSCSKAPSVTGGFGSETSTGIVLTVATGTGDTNRVIFELYQSQAAPLNGFAPTPIKTDTIYPNQIDSIDLESGTYTVLSRQIGTEMRTISQNITVKNMSVTPVVDTLASDGLVILQFPDSIRTSDLIAYVPGTNLMTPLSAGKNGTAGTREVTLAAPAGNYDSIMVLDSRITSKGVLVGSNVTVQSNAMSTVPVILTNWPSVVKTDGMLTVNWYYPTNIGVNYDSVVTSLIPVNYTPFNTNTIRKFSKTGVGGGGPLTIPNVAYGSYWLIAESFFTDGKFKAAIPVKISNNQNFVCSDTLDTAVTLKVQIPNSKVVAGTICVLEGLSQSILLDTVSSNNGSREIVFTGIPAGVESRAMVISPSRVLTAQSETIAIEFGSSIILK